MKLLGTGLLDKYPLPLDEFGVQIDPQPMLPEQVMGMVVAMRESADIWKIFQRMGKYGLPNDEEFKAIELFRENYMRDHGLAHLNRNGFFGAVILLRNVVLGEILSVDSEVARIFLREDYKRNAINRQRPGGGYRLVSTNIVEIMWLANHVMRRTDFWELFEDDARNSGDPLRKYIGSERWKRFWMFEYAPYYGVTNRNGLYGRVTGTLSDIALGILPALESAETWQALENVKSLYTNQLPPEKCNGH